MVVFIVTALKLEVPDVTDIDWELPAGHVEDGAAPVLTEPVRVHCGGHVDHSQRPLAAPGPALDCRLQDITQSERSQTDPLTFTTPKRMSVLTVLSWASSSTTQL